MNVNKVNIKDLANFILLYLIKNEIKINHLKLQKILYYIQAWHMVYFDKNPLFDEKPEAWVNGPVYRSVYNIFKDKNAVDIIDVKDNFNSDIDRLYKEAKEKLNLTDKQFEFLDAVLKHYGLMTHEKLIYLTHSELPWNKAREGLDAFEYSNNLIDLNLMYNYYKEKLNSKKVVDEL